LAIIANNGNVDGYNSALVLTYKTMSEYNELNLFYSRHTVCNKNIRSDLKQATKRWYHGGIRNISFQVFRKTILTAEIAENLSVSGAPFRTPLGELTDYSAP